MRIEYFAHSVLNRGGDRMVLLHAANLVGMGHTVTFVVNEFNTVFPVHPGIHVRKLSTPGKLGSLLAALLHKSDADCIIASIIPMAFLLMLRNLHRVVYFAQADDVEYYASPLLRMLMNTLYRLYFNMGTLGTISMSGHLSSILKRRFDIATMETLETGIDHTVFFQDEDQPLLEVKQSRIAVVFMARGDAYRKGFDVAFKALSSLDKTLVDRLELWVCGDNIPPERFLFTVRNFGLVSDERLRKILSSADIFLYPSRHEGFGLFPLEAMACGCVAVTSQALPYAETLPCIVTAPIGDVGMLADQLARLIVDDERRLSLKTQGMDAAKQYDVRETTRAFCLALERLVAGGLR